MDSCRLPGPAARCHREPHAPPARVSAGVVAAGGMNANLVYSETAECRLSADFELVGRTLCLLNGYLHERGLDPAIWAELELATAEALNNAVEHGCAGLEGAEVSCRWSWTGDAIRIEITDPGHYAPPPGEDALPEDKLAERGRGAFLMARLMDA